MYITLFNDYVTTTDITAKAPTSRTRTVQVLKEAAENYILNQLGLPIDIAFERIKKQEPRFARQVTTHLDFSSFRPNHIFTEGVIYLAHASTDKECPR